MSLLAAIFGVGVEVRNALYDRQMLKSHKLRGPVVSIGNLSTGGAGIKWMNPKGWEMGMGAAASFAALADGPGQLALLLGSTFGLTAAISLSVWCMAGMVLARLLKTEWQWRALNIVLALVLAASIIPMWRSA